MNDYSFDQGFVFPTSHPMACSQPNFASPSSVPEYL